MLDKRGLIQFLPKFGNAAKWRREAAREAAIRPLSFFLFLAYQLYSCAATRLSQEVITVNLPFNCKIFLQFHPVSEISEKGNERI